MAGFEHEKRHKVLITLSEEARGSIETIAGELRALGLEGAEVFSLGGIIAGEAATGDLSKMSQLSGVISIESEPNLRSF